MCLEAGLEGGGGNVVLSPAFLQARCDAGCTAMLDGRWAIVERREGGGGRIAAAADPDTFRSPQLLWQVVR